MSLFSGFSEDKLQQLITELRADGFETYLTSVGGSGVGLLSPHVSDGHGSVNAYVLPVTPPETSDLEDNTEPPSSLRTIFENAAPKEFASWAEQRGRWLYV